MWSSRERQNFRSIAAQTHYCDSGSCSAPAYQIFVPVRSGNRLSHFRLVISYSGLSHCRSEIWVANLVRSPLRSAPWPIRFSLRSRSIVLSHARLPLCCRSLNLRPAALSFLVQSRSAHMLWSAYTKMASILVSKKYITQKDTAPLGTSKKLL